MALWWLWLCSPSYRLRWKVYVHFIPTNTGPQNPLSIDKGARVAATGRARPRGRSDISHRRGVNNDEPPQR